MVPPPQRNYEEAAARALSAARSRSRDELQWWGARPADGKWALPVLDETFRIDLDAGKVTVSGGEAVRVWWVVLALHYLSVPGRPLPGEPEVSFAELPGGRGYAPVYNGRVIQRLCGTAGRDAETLRQAAEGLGAAPVEGPGDLAYDFRVFPRVRLRLVWYAGDEELPPSAALLLPRNIEALFCIEDIVVLSERVISRLSGGRF